MGDIVRFNSKASITAAGSRSLTVGNSAVAFTTLTVPEKANYCTIRVEKNASTTNTAVARYTKHGTDPTSSVGFPMADMDVFTFDKGYWNDLVFISTDSNNQTLTILWWEV